MHLNQPSRPRRFAPLMLCVCAFALASRAEAEDFSTANLPIIVEQACGEVSRAAEGEPQSGDLAFDEGQWREVPSSRVAFFVAAYAREALSPGEALTAIGGLRDNPERSGRYLLLSDTVYDFQLNLAGGKLDGLKAFGPDGKPVVSRSVDPSASWFVGPGVTLRCLVPEKSKPKRTGNPLSIRLRGNTDALPATGTELKSADAAVIGFNRTRTFEDDGSRKQTNEVSINAVLGAVKKVNNNFAVTGYVGYELKQSRVKLTPTLVPPATERDADTDILTFGVMGEAYVPLGGKNQPWATSLRLTFSGSYLFDWVKDSERVRGEFTAGLFHRAPIDVTLTERKKRKSLLGICDLGGYSHIAPGVWTRCDVQAIVSYNQVTKQGSLTPSGNDQFGHAGGKASVSLYLGDPSKKSSFFLGADYLYQLRYAGDPNEIPDIRRHSITLGHRWWQSKGFAIEIKASLADGINPDSFADENALTLGFGIIF
jgi:hypothetical protein